MLLHHRARARAGPRSRSSRAAERGWPAPPPGADVVAAFARGLIWLWLLFSGAMLGSGIFLMDATHHLRPVALSFGSALLTRALLGRVGLRRGEVFTMMLAIVGLRLPDTAMWTAFDGSRIWAVTMLGLGSFFAALALVLHLLYLRARRALSEASRK